MILGIRVSAKPIHGHSIYPAPHCANPASMDQVQPLQTLAVHKGGIGVPQELPHTQFFEHRLGDQSVQLGFSSQQLLGQAPEQPVPVTYEPCGQNPASEQGQGTPLAGATHN